MIDALFVGKPQRFDGEKLSAFARSPVDGPVLLTYDGLYGDEVADKVNHGGPDKALHLYPSEHYPFWQTKLPEHPLLDAAGAFGENVSASGLTEHKVKIGDRFRIGRALVEVSHGRQPCWKIDHRFGAHGLSREVIRSGRCGLYFRVIEAGQIAAGDTIAQVEEVMHDWTVARVFQVLIAGGYKASGGKEALKELSMLSPLADAWRERAAQLA